MIGSTFEYVAPLDTIARSAWPGDRPQAVTPGVAKPLALLPVAPLGPRCTMVQRPVAGRPLPEAPAPAEGIAELREWAQRNYRWLELSRWSRGIPALAAPMRPRREPVPVSQMSLADLERTQDDELPSISAEAFDELGTKALSLDASATFDDEVEEGTIAERLGAEAIGLLLAEVEPEVSLEPIWADALEFALDNLELRYGDAFEAEADEFTAEFNVLVHQYVGEEMDALRERMARRYGVAFDVPSPQVRQRIEWEKYVAQCSGITRHEGLRLKGNDLQYFTFPVVRGQDFINRKKAFISAFLARHGMTQMPSPAEFTRHRNVLRALAKQHGYRLAAERLDAAFGEMDAERQWLIERDGAMSWDEPEFDYVPSYALLRERAWAELKPTGWVGRDTYRDLRARARQAAYATWQQLNAEARAAKQQRQREGRDMRHVCRVPRLHGGRDEMWHAEARDPSEFAIGFMDDGFRFANRSMKEIEPYTGRTEVVARPITTRDLLRVEGAAQNALNRFAVHVFRLGKQMVVHTQ